MKLAKKVWTFQYVLHKTTRSVCNAVDLTFVQQTVTSNTLQPANYVSAIGSLHTDLAINKKQILSSSYVIATTCDPSALTLLPLTSETRPLCHEFISPGQSTRTLGLTESGMGRKLIVSLRHTTRSVSMVNRGLSTVNRGLS